MQIAEANMFLYVIIIKYAFQFPEGTRTLRQFSGLPRPISLGYLDVKTDNQRKKPMVSTNII